MEKESLGWGVGSGEEKGWSGGGAKVVGGDD